MTIEGDGIPVEYERNMQHVRNSIPIKKGDAALLPWQIQLISEEEVNRPIWKVNCMESFIQSTLKYISNNVVDRLVKVRQMYKLQAGVAIPSEDYMDIDIDEDITGNDSQSS
jgi:DNA-directed RNA polymerase III subunit RPC1